MDFSGMQQGMGAGGAIGEALFSMIGAALEAGDLDRAQGLAVQMRRKYGDLVVPELERLYPELMGDTALAGNAADERYTSVEDAALADMMSRARGEMTPEDEANLMRARLESEGSARATTAALDRMRARRGFGRSGGGVNDQVAAQQAANRLYQGGVQAAGDASARGLQALGMGANYASSLAGRDLNQKNLVGGARDRITQFNLGRKDQAVTTRNEAAQDEFGDQLAKLEGESPWVKQQMDYIGRAGGARNRALRGFGNLAGSIIGAAAGS